MTWEGLNSTSVQGRGEEETGLFSYDSRAQGHIIVSAFGTGTLWYLHEDFLNFTLSANVGLYFPEGVTRGCVSLGGWLHCNSK